MLSRTGIVNEIPTKRLWLLQLDAAQARNLLEGRGDSERPWMRGYPIEGTLVAAQARGKGYATEALQALIGWALAQPEVRRVEADTAHGNVPSQRVMERAGMRLIGRNDRLRFYRYP